MLAFPEVPDGFIFAVALGAERAGCIVGSVLGSLEWEPVM